MFDWIRSGILEFYFGVQRLLWWMLLNLLLPDCRNLVDDKIIAAEGQASSKKILDEIYRFLGILDSKASALMRYNGIILAVIALMERSRQELPGTVYSIVIMTICSILACLLVVGVYWRFLEWVDPTANDKLADELAVLRRVLILREAAYQLAWWLSAGVLIIFLVHFVEFLPQQGAAKGG
jgi:hypothetical protein